MCDIPDELSSLLGKRKSRLPVLLEDCAFYGVDKQWIPSHHFKKFTKSVRTSFVHVPFALQKAPSGFSKCRGCGHLIAKGSVRVGYPIKDPRGDYGAISCLMHPKCGRSFIHDTLTARSITIPAPDTTEGWDCIWAAWDTLEEEEAVELGKTVFGALSETEDADEVSGIEELEKLAHRKIFDRMPAPSSLMVPLLPFQEEGLAWLCSQEESDVKGGILADEMGMGKTIQLIALLLARPVTTKSAISSSSASSSDSGVSSSACSSSQNLSQEGNTDVNLSCPVGGTLVVAPLAALLQWKQEIEKFVVPGALTVFFYHGTNRNSRPKELCSADVVITSYHTLEADYRKIVDKHKLTCRYCKRKFLRDKLILHQRYFCGPEAERTAKQALTKKKSKSAATKAMATLNISSEDKSFLPTPANVYREIMAQANREHDLEAGAGGAPWMNPRHHILQRVLNSSKEEQLLEDNKDEEVLVTHSSEACRSSSSTALGSAVSCNRRKSSLDEAEEQYINMQLQEIQEANQSLHTTASSSPRANNSSNARINSHLIKSTDDKTAQSDIVDLCLTKSEILEETKCLVSKTGIAKLGILELRVMLADNNLSTEGTKPQLVKRVTGHLYPTKRQTNIKLEHSDGMVPNLCKSPRLLTPPPTPSRQRERTPFSAGVGEIENCSASPADQATFSVVLRRSSRLVAAPQSRETQSAVVSSGSLAVAQRSTVPGNKVSRGPKKAAGQTAKTVAKGHTSSTEKPAVKGIKAAGHTEGLQKGNRKTGRKKGAQGGQSASIKKASVSVKSKSKCRIRQRSPVLRVTSRRKRRKGCSTDEEAESESSYKSSVSEYEASDADDNSDDAGPPHEKQIGTPNKRVGRQKGKSELKKLVPIVVESDQSGGEEMSDYEIRSIASNASEDSRASDSDETEGTKKRTKRANGTASPTATRSRQDRRDPSVLWEEEDAGDQGISTSSSIMHSICWGRIVLDEAHRIKARTTSTAKAIYSLRGSGYKWCLTGTPLQNRVGELYSLVRFLRVDPFAFYFCSKQGCDCKSLHFRFSNNRYCLKCDHTRMCHFSYFNRKIVKPIKNYGFQGEGKEAMKCLKQEVLDSVMLRRTKVERATDVKLPPLTVQIRRDKLSESEKDFYEGLYKQTRLQFDTYVDAGTVLHNFAHIFDLLSRLRQAVDHPYLIVHGPSSVNMPSSSKGGTRICGICQEGTELYAFIEARCKHTFHRECVMEYIQSAPDNGPSTEKLGCPVCYSPLTVDFSQVHAGVPSTQAEEEPSVPVTSNERCSVTTRNCSGGGSQQQAMSPEDVNEIVKKGWAGVKGGIMSRIKTAEFKSSTKIDALLEELERVNEEDPSAKSIVFSQYTAMLELIMWKLNTTGITCVKYTGSLTVPARSNMLHAFNIDPSLKVILISLKAGGEGLNLQVANNIFVMDPWWNPAAEMQAIQRAHRIGQTKPVRALRFIADGTIEERMLQLQEKKKLVFEGTVGQSDAACCKLTAEDIRFLFQT
eukprot:GHVQ01031404.1.p1 GENE.GHVQ01031404.1~~GHVQ01031404.1.p1  ORF type:complete len:1497 (-),score=222.63 GHVQ01031404.1:2193-6683(-)